MSDRSLPRRTFATAAAGVAMFGIAGCTDGDEPAGPIEDDQEDDDSAGDDPANGEEDEDAPADEDPPDVSDWEGVEEIRMEAHADGWVGVEPELIADTENPGWALFVEEQYTITIENMDGEDHMLAIENLEGDVVEDYETETISEEGDEISLQIEASDEMTLYVCHHFEEEMAGEIRTEDPIDMDPDEDPEEEAVEEDEDPTESENETSEDGSDDTDS